MTFRRSARTPPIPGPPAAQPAAMGTLPHAGPSPAALALRHAVTIACEIQGGPRSTSVFSSTAFAVAIQREFDLRGQMDAEWCKRVLRGLDWVTELPGDGGYWKAQ